MGIYFLCKEIEIKKLRKKVSSFCQHLFSKKTLKQRKIRKLEIDFIIKECGGSISPDMKNADFCLGFEKKFIKLEWLFESICQNEILPIDKYEN